MADDSPFPDPPRPPIFLLPAASRPYRRPAFWAHGSWVYFEVQKPTVWAIHRHAAHVQVWLVFDGAECTARWRTGPTNSWVDRKIPARHVWIVPHDTEHALEWNREADLLVFFVELDWVRAVTGEQIVHPSLEPLSRYSEVTPIIGELCRLFRGQCHTPGPANTQVFAGLGSALIGQLLVAHFAPRRTATRPQGLVLPRTLLADLRTFIEANLHEKLSLALLARRAGLSPSYFGQMFKAAIGLSPLAFVIECRVLRARTLLQTGRFTVKEVAHDVGFSDQHQMDHHFMRLLENTPSSYRPRNIARVLPHDSRKSPRRDEP
jgi:AraC family transcriptional regulator